MGIRDEIRNDFEVLKDEAYGQFQAKLIPTINRGCIIGVRTPDLKKLAKRYAVREDCNDFLNQLPHTYFEENQLHSFIIALDKDFGHCIGQVERFLPYIDNWATCDQLSPKIFKKETDRLLRHVDLWIQSEHTYTIRFGIGVLMNYFLGENYEAAYAQKVVELQSEEYYVNMMRAWYFATALAKQYQSILPILEEQKLDVWTHNKTIQKAIESYRLTDEQKKLLRNLKQIKSSSKGKIRG